MDDKSQPQEKKEPQAVGSAASKPEGEVGPQPQAQPEAPESVQQTAPPPTSPPTPTPEVKKGVSPLLIAGFVAVGVVLAGIFVYFYTIQGSKPSTETQNQQVTPSALPSPAPTVDQTTDAALEAESSDLEVDIEAVDSGLREVDQGINDQPGDLSEY